MDVPEELSWLYGESGEVEFYEHEGQLWWICRIDEPVPTKYHSASFVTYESAAKVPKKVQAQGEEAVRRYAERRVKADFTRQRGENKKWEAFERNPDNLVETTHNGILLKGRIFSAEDTTLQVRLEQPFQGEKVVIYGYGSAMNGHYRFEGPGIFSEHAINTARQMLVDIYLREKRKQEHGNVIELAKQLNER